jgi:hypothetical protein
MQLSAFQCASDWNIPKTQLYFSSFVPEDFSDIHVKPFPGILPFCLPQTSIDGRDPLTKRG